MTQGIVKVQGTHIYFVDPNGASNLNLIKLDCPTGLTGIGGGAKAQIDTTCMDETEDRTQVTGLGTPAPVSIPVNFIPSSPAHQALMALKASGESVDWIGLLSDGTAAPTLVADEIVPPDAPLRTSVQWEAAVSEFVIDFQSDDIVRGTLSLLRSGSETWNWNGPVPA